MGWYLKKSFAFGPLRLNLSKSGIGASVGVKGLRVSKGPKGKQLNAGREGLYYRASLNSPVNSQALASRATDAATKTADEGSAVDKGRVAQAVATGVGMHLGNQLVRGIFRGLFKKR